MAWITVIANDGIYNVDWQSISKIVRSFVRSEAMLTYSTENTDGHWVGPDLHTIDVNWEKIRSETEIRSECILNRMYYTPITSMRPLITQLLSFVEKTRLNNLAFQAKMRHAQHATMENIKSSVNLGEKAVWSAEVIRDSSAEFLMVSATIVSGGAAAGLGLGLGATLKTTAKYQDAKFHGQDPSKIPSNKQLAGFFAVEFGAGLIDLAGAKYIKGMAEAAGEAAKLRGMGEVAAKAATKGAETGLALLWNIAKGATVEPAKAIVEAQLLDESHKTKGILTGGLKIVGGTHVEIFKYLLKAGREKGEIIAALADTVASRAADALSERITSKEEQEAAQAAPHVTIVTPKSREQLMVDAILYERKTIEQTAICPVGTTAPTNYAFKPRSNPRPLVFQHARHGH